MERVLAEHRTHLPWDVIVTTCPTPSYRMSTGKFGRVFATSFFRLETPFDHNAITFSLTQKAISIRDSTSSQTVRCYRKINKEQFESDLRTFVVTLVLQLSSTLVSSDGASPTSLDDIINSFNSKIKEVIDKHAPIRYLNGRKRRSSPWFSKSLYGLR
jgi:hypothetical protein